MKTHTYLGIAPAIAVAVLFACMPAVAQEGEQEQAMLGDLNRDGACNILDIQAMVAQALQVRERTREADLDENGEVDIFDIQNGVNTALETGGLVRRVRGQVECDGEGTQDRLRVRAVAQDGQCVEGEVDPETGEWSLALRVKNAWSFAFFNDNQEQGQPEAGIVQFQYGEQVSCLLPLAEMSKGEELDLGQLQYREQMQLREDARTKLAYMARRMNNADNNADGIPDFCEPLMNRAQNGPGVPEQMRQAGGLAEFVAPCIEGWLDQITTPSLVDENDDGVPDFIEPLIACIETKLADWFAAHGQQMPEGQGPGGPGENQGSTFVEELVAYIVDGIPDWLANLNNPDVIDVNDDGIPDYLEALLGTPGGPNAVDADGDGKPDFAQDHDGDGIPNCQDEDFQRPEDCDGDGIGNAQDRDCDNDGVPNYADAEPCNPDVQ